MFKNPASEFVTTRTYLRWVEDFKRREMWPETVDRYVNFIQEELKDKIPPKVIRKIREKMLNFEVMPSMRALWSAGPAARASNVCMYNCSALVVDSVEAFSEAVYILCCGAGLGFSVQKEYVNKLPVVKEPEFISNGIFVIEDNKEGWADSVKVLMNSLYDGKDVLMDYSKIRPAGARLKTMGGKASGAEPLMSLHRFIREIFRNAHGRQLTTLEAHDIMNKIAEIVTVGGVRRSSEISLSDLNDESMRSAKKWPFPLHRTMANNSAVYTEKPSAVEFMKEWTNLAASGTGERGIFNLYSVRKNAPVRRDKISILLTNPCQPSNATVLTPDGIKTIGDISIGDMIWSGKVWTKIISKQSSGIKPTFRYLTTAGQFVGTENHRIIQNGLKTEVKEAKSIDWNTGLPTPLEPLDPQDVIDGLMIGDGSFHKASNNLIFLYIGKKDGDYFDSEVSHLIKRARPGITEEAFEVQTTIQCKELPKTFLRIIPDRFYYGNEKKKKGFLRGLFSANGSLAGGRISLKQTSKELILQVQTMLSSLGIHSYITTNKSRINTFANGEYVMKESYDLNIISGRTLFRETIGFLQKYKQENIKDSSTPRYRTSGIRSVESLGDMEVFNITVEDGDHTYWTGGCLVSNCGETALRNHEFCNLSEAVVRENDDLDSLLEKVETATWICVIQSTFTKFPYLRPSWKKNCEEERLLGVSLTGQMDNKELLSPVALKALRQKAIKVAKHASQKLGINMPAAITLVKPSGTVSQVVDSSSGLHPRYAKFYIRRYRISAQDPLCKMMFAQGIKLIPEVGQEGLPEDKVSTWVIEFPMKSPANSVTRDKMTAIEQLEWYKNLLTNWCEQNPSTTIYVKNDEWLEVGNWLYKNFSIVNGISFLPYDGGEYKLAPYEEITEEKYKKLVEKFKPIDYTQLSKFEMEDNTEGAKTLACSGGLCEI